MKQPVVEENWIKKYCFPLKMNLCRYEPPEDRLEQGVNLCQKRCTIFLFEQWDFFEISGNNRNSHEGV